MDCDTAGEKLSSAIYIISIIQGIADAGRAHEQSSRSLSAISLHLMDIYYQVPGIYHKAWRARPISIHGIQTVLLLLPIIVLVLPCYLTLVRTSSDALSTAGSCSMLKRTKQLYTRPHNWAIGVSRSRGVVRKDGTVRAVATTTVLYIRSRFNRGR